MPAVDYDGDQRQLPGSGFGPFTFGWIYLAPRSDLGADEYRIAERTVN